jgi:hypothetical protein
LPQRIDVLSVRKYIPLVSILQDTVGDKGVLMNKTGSQKESTERVNFTLPDLSDQESLQRFAHELKANVHLHGVRRLLRQTELFLRYIRMQEDCVRRMKVALQVVNGQRTALQLQKDRERGWRQTAQRFYGTLSDEGLYTYAMAVTPIDSSLPTYSKDELIDHLVEMYVKTKYQERRDLQSVEV